MNKNINCFTLMGNASKKLKGNFFKCLLATFIVIAPLVAIAFIPYYVGLIVSLFFSGYLFYGLTMYYKQLFKGENPKLSVIFNNWKKFGSATLLGIINFTGMLVGFILLIFPSLAYVVYYCVNMHILTDSEQGRVITSCKENAYRMYCNKTLVLSYKVLFYFMMAVVLAICGLLFVPISSLYSSNLALSVFLGVVVVLLGIVLLTLVQVLYQATQMEFYLYCLPSKADAEEYRKLANERAVAKHNNKSSSDHKEEATTTETTTDSKPEEVEEVVEKESQPTTTSTKKPKNTKK